ncbi:TonB-dependent siderophore receptor [Synoicihabitans lomoniglobus]|uniref:TonB-dependent receptor plug domain-containing protein n=1 Tax=Synoicihabitans lomoniglobus TaxID=2909285 RepID=A0AAF0CSD2_9BACT|nr:TonB-dependent receptor plug domain-containing protein [Opitutaceae bacterium LMO-M01]WED67223.1 TonB-dependent receptor plug domain-containing protein [Opitutaceae bacterium LMO-M01]
MSEEDIVMLSVFSVDVSEDKGYRATNSISGTSLNTAIQDLPMPLEVITAEFVDDLAATDFEEALSYTSGVFTDENRESSGDNSRGANASYSAELSPSTRGGLGGSFSNAISIRGYNVQFQNRMGFRVGGTVSEYGVTLGGVLDSLNYERLEVVRGPSSLLYGIGVLSGIVNIIPERPLPEQKTTLSASMGNFGFKRFTAETTGPLAASWIPGDLRYRIGLAQEEREHWTDFRTKDLDYLVGQIDYSPWSSTNIFLEYQRANTRYGGTGTQYLYDDLSGIAYGGELRNEFNEQYNWSRDFSGVGPEYRISGPDTFEERDEWNFLANLDIEPIEGLTLNMGGYWGGQDTDDFDVRIRTINNQESNIFVKRRVRRPDGTYRTILQYVPDRFIQTFENPPSPVFPDTNDNKTARAYWSNSVRSGVFEQYRVRANYQFETPFLGGPAQHNILFGRHDIKDTIDYPVGAELVTRMFTPVNLASNPDGDPSDEDSIVFRDIYETEPYQYNGELLAQPGREYQQTDLWYTGHYAIYQGRFWDDRMMFIGGVRHDRYQGLEKEYDRQNGVAGLIENPENETYGFLSEEYNFDEPIRVTTSTFALRYDIREGLAAYGLVAEGVSPNTGALDGNDDFIDAERSLSKEIGVKWDLAGGKLSGTLSVYEIERDNAIWRLEGAPTPANWVGGSNRGNNRARPLIDFEAAAILDGTAPLSYAVDSVYFDAADLQVDPVTRKYKDGILAVESTSNSSAEPRVVVFLDYNKLDAAGFRDEIEEAFADVGKTRSTLGDGYDPIRYDRSQGTYFGINPSEYGATNVTFSDRARGVDTQLVYAPIENWQVIFNYAYTTREVTDPFDLVAAVDQLTGVEFGTEYDLWVRTFGRAAYGLEEIDDDGDGLPDRILKDGQPVSMTNIVPADSAAGGIEGTSLYFGAAHEASVWNKYTFVEGPLRKLSLLAGVRYTGPRPTTTSVGGSDLAENLYGTPDTETRINVDLGLVYNLRWKKTDWRFALNVYNVLNDQKGYTETSYVNVEDGSIEKRRTEVFYSPISYRLSARMSF